MARKLYLAGNTLVGVGDDEAADKVLGVFADVLPIPLVEDEGALGTFLEQIGEGFAAEWRVAAKKRIRNDTHGPHVNGLAVALSVHDLGGGITKRASHGLESLLLVVKRLCDAEIGKNQVGSGILSNIQQVLGFQI